MALFNLELPTSQYPNYSYTTTLDGKEYEFNFIYNVRMVSWYLNIYKLDGTALLNGVRMTSWLDYLYTHSKTDLPLGELYLVPISAPYPTAPTITLENLSTEFQLIYNSVT